MDKRAEILLKKAITELNNDISLATIKRGASFLKSYGQVPALKVLATIITQTNMTKNVDNPNYNPLKTYDDYIQNSLFTSYPTFEQINHARDLLNKLNS